MTIRTRHIVYFFLALIDAALIFGSFQLASWFYSDVLSVIRETRAANVVLWDSIGLPLVVPFAFALVFCYSVSSVYGSAYLGFVRRMAKRIVVINTIGFVVFAAVLYVLRLGGVSRSALLLFYGFSTVLILLKNWVALQAFYRIRKGKRALRPVLVVGSGALAQRYAYVIGTSPSRLEHVVGYVDSSGTGEVRGDQGTGISFLGPRLGSLDDLDSVLSSVWVEEIVIALDVDEYDCVPAVYSAADKGGVRLTLVPFYNEIIPRMPEVDSVQNVTLVNLRSMPLDSVLNAFAKRFVDVAVSILVIALTSWLMLIAAAGVKLSSPGPILFKQERTGRNGRSFEMLKFRSMRIATGEVSTFTEDKDERKTKFGTLIRKLSIDEFPQFFNVLKGDMSIIGPRPVVGEETEEYRNKIPLYMLRHQVRPGISGWAQINGYRGDPAVDEVAKRTELDLWYIQHWTLWLDVKIFLRTLFGGFVNGEKLS